MTFYGSVCFTILDVINETVCVVVYIEITDSRGIFQCGSNKWIRMLFMPYITGHSMDCCRLNGRHVA